MREYRARIKTHPSVTYSFFFFALRLFNFSFLFFYFGAYRCDLTDTVVAQTRAADAGEAPVGEEVVDLVDEAGSIIGVLPRKAVECFTIPCSLYILVCASSFAAFIWRATSRSVSYFCVGSGAFVQQPSPWSGHSGRAASRRRDLRAPAQQLQTHFSCGTVRTETIFNYIFRTGKTY